MSEQPHYRDNSYSNYVPVTFNSGSGEASTSGAQPGPEHPLLNNGIFREVELADRSEETFTAKYYTSSGVSYQLTPPCLGKEGNTVCSGSCSR
jgi:hypothetical protein